MLYLGSANGSFHPFTRDVATGWSGLFVTDLNGDGKDDIAVSNNTPGASAITILFSK
jgi:hypothetical protein